MGVVTVADNTGTISISDGNSVIYIEKKKVDVTAQGGNVTIRWDENTYATYTAAQFISPSGTAAAIAAAIAVFLDTGASSGVTGSGTLNYIPKWTPSGSALGNSLLFDNGTSVLLGGTTAIASAQFAMTSTTQGFLMPKMTTAQKNLISTPATGLQVFDTTLGLFSYYTGAAWVQLDVGEGTDWSILGNAGTVAGTNFIGTTDDVNLVFKRNNVQSGLIAHSTNNTSFGSAALLSTSTGLANSAFGAGALAASSSGGFNTAVGTSALYLNTIGTLNTAVGVNALNQNLSGEGNTALGLSAGHSNSTGTYSVFLGHYAGYYETGSSKLFIDNQGRTNEATGRISALIYGVFNATVASQTLRFNASVGVNTAPLASTAFSVLGFDTSSSTYAAKFQNSASTDLFAVRNDGFIAAGNTTSKGLTVGAGSGWVTTATTYNTIFGQENYPSLNSTSLRNTLFGYATMGTSSGGLDDNTVFGYGGLYYGSGSGNTMMGSSAGLGITSANNCVGIGYNTFLQLGASGDRNIAIGYEAIHSPVSGVDNIAIGAYANYGLNAANRNIGIGYSALYTLSTGADNVALGYSSGANITTSGSTNTLIGSGTGQAMNGASSGNVFLGYRAGYNQQGLTSNLLLIDAIDRTSGANELTRSLIYGVFNATVASQTLRFNASVGVNTAPLASTAFSVLGFDTSSSTYAAKFQNSASTDLFAVRNDGCLPLGIVGTNAFLGFGVGYNRSTGVENVGLGYNALQALTTANQNVAIGFEALYNNAATQHCIAIGSGALKGLGTSATGTGDNIAIGYHSNYTGGAAINYNQISIGSYALELNTGGENLAIGHQAIGLGSGQANFNTAIGHVALGNLSTGDENTALGYNAGKSMTTGGNSVFLGAYAGQNRTTQSNELFIDNRNRGSAAADLTASLVYGIFAAVSTDQYFTINGNVTANGRMLETQGTDAASASTLTLTYTGNTFELTGTTAVDYITTTGWQDGSVITLVANESVTINNNTGTVPASTKQILLAGAANFAMTANDTLTLVLCSTTAGGQAWRELCRTAI